MLGDEPRNTSSIRRSKTGEASRVRVFSTVPTTMLLALGATCLKDGQTFG